MATWIPVLVHSEDCAEIAALVAEREAGRTDSPIEVTTAPVDHIRPLLAKGQPGSQEVHRAKSPAQAARCRQVRGST